MYSHPEILSPSDFVSPAVLVFGQHCLVDGEYAKALHPEVVWHLMQQLA
jgi:hypothetical protein